MGKKRVGKSTSSSTQASSKETMNRQGKRAIPRMSLSTKLAQDTVVVTKASYFIYSFSMLMLEKPTENVHQRPLNAYWIRVLLDSQFIFANPAHSIPMHERLVCLPPKSTSPLQRSFVCPFSMQSPTRPPLKCHQYQLLSHHSNLCLHRTQRCHQRPRDHICKQCQQRSLPLRGC